MDLHDVSTGRLPPGQVATRKFPVVGEKAPAAAAVDLATWRLEVAGLVATPLELTYEDILAQPQQELCADIHCVTGWTHFAMHLTGFPVAELLARAGVLDEARFVRFEAWSERHHDTTLPLALVRSDTWLIHSRDGRPLEPEHGFPLRTVTPSRYFYKSLKWVRRIELLASDRLGYWERESAYHNQADPWAGDQRFTTGSLDPKKAEAFKKARDFTPYRGPRRVMLGLDLREWQPASRDLRGLQLKHCDLRHAHLSGVDLRDANLSLSCLVDADLSGADLRGVDIEGADLSGADLSGADLRQARLTATRFFSTPADGSAPLSAKIAGLRWDGASGLLEDQEAFLRRG